MCVVIHNVYAAELSLLDLVSGGLFYSNQLCGPAIKLNFKIFGERRNLLLQTGKAIFKSNLPCSRLSNLYEKSFAECTYCVNEISYVPFRATRLS